MASSTLLVLVILELLSWLNDALQINSHQNHPYQVSHEHTYPIQTTSLHKYTNVPVNPRRFMAEHPDALLLYCDNRISYQQVQYYCNRIFANPRLTLLVSFVCYMIQLHFYLSQVLYDINIWFQFQLFSLDLHLLFHLKQLNIG